MLTVNSLIKWDGLDDKVMIERILWINKNENMAFVIDTNSNSFPILRPISEIEGYIEDGTVAILNEDPIIRIVNEENISQKDKNNREAAWNVISEIVELEPQIYDFKERRSLITEAALKHKVSQKTVEKYLKRYWKRGKVKNALLPDYHMCGGRGKERKAGERKRGRPRKNHELLGFGVNIDESIKQIFRTAINRYYHSSSRPTLTLTYQLMLKDYFYDDFKVENGVKVPILKPSSQIPSFSQFRYWWLKKRDLKKEISSRISLKNFQKDHRTIIGSSDTETMGPGSLYQIDATIGDIYLVSRFNRNWIVGKPVITYVIDVFSRLLVGFAVTLEGPSWISAMQALANTATSKVEFCKEFGISIDEQDWPAHYLPECILADRGEIEGKNIESLINALNIKVKNTPPYRADFKGVVERYIKTVSGYTTPLLPGTVDIRAKERGDRDIRLDAKLDLYQFTQIIIKCVLFYNNQHCMGNYERDLFMVEDSIMPIAREIWNWGIKNRSGKLRTVPEDIVKLHLMPRNTATVTAKGVKFKGMLYGSPMTIKERWYERARNIGSFKINVSYDPRNMNYIYINGIGENGFEKCYLLEHQSRYKDKCLEEIQYLIKVEKNQNSEIADVELQSKVDLITEIDDIVRQASKASTQEYKSNESNTERISGIRENRKHEINTEREKQAFELYKEVVVETEVIPLDSGSLKEDNDIELLQRKQRERFKISNE